MCKTMMAYVLLASLSIMLASCGGPKGTQVKLSLNLGAVVDASNSGGGGVLYGKKTDGSEPWSDIIAQGALGANRTLNNGSWEFYIVVWQGPGIFEGGARCGTAAISLDGTATNVTLDVSAASCNTSQFAQASYHDAVSGFLPLRLVSCNNFAKVIDGSSVCDHPASDMGYSKSFKLQMRGSESAGEGGHWSRCLSQAGLINHRKNDSVYFSNVRMPVGGTLPFPVTIRGYEDENCTTTYRDYDFPNGIGGPGDLVSGTNYTSSNNGTTLLQKIDYQLWPTTNPFSGSGPGAYQTTQSTDLTFTRVMYTSDTMSSYSYNSSMAPTCDTNAVSLPGLPMGYMGSQSCPQTQDWTCTGTQCTGGLEPPHCKSDYSNSTGPNCDAGFITTNTIDCNKDMYPNIVCYQTTVVRYCGGNASCGWNGGPNPSPSYASLYLIDNEYGVGNSALSAQSIEVQCQVTGSGSSGFRGCVAEQIDHESGIDHDHDGDMGVQNNYSEFYQIQSDLFGLDDPDMTYTGGHRNLGTIGDLRSDLLAGGVGGILYRIGYSDCASIPTSGSFSLPMYSMEQAVNVSLDLQFAPGQKIIPSWAGTGSGSGAPFEKRVTLNINSAPNVVMEFNCTTNIKSGYRYDTYGDAGEFSEKEIYYKVNSPTDTQFETAGYSSGTWGGNISIRHSLQGFKKQTASVYQLWSNEVSRWDYSDGSGTQESWHAQNIMANGNRSKVRLSSFDGNRDGDINAPTAASAYIGGVPFRIDASATGPAYNGMRVSVYGSGSSTGTMNGSGSGGGPYYRWVTGSFDGSSGPGQSTYQDIIDGLNGYQSDFVMVFDNSEDSSGSGPTNSYDYFTSSGTSGNHLYLTGGSNSRKIMETNGNFKINYFTQTPYMSYINNSDPHDDFYQGLAIFNNSSGSGWTTGRYGNHCNNGGYSGSGTFQVVGVVGSGFSASTSYNLGMVENPFATLNSGVGTSIVELTLSGSGTGGSGTGFGMEYILKGMLLGPSTSGSGMGTVIESTAPNKFRVWVQSGSFAGGNFTMNFYDMSAGSGSGGSGSGGGVLMNITDLAMGAGHVCALVGIGTGSGSVFCWGDNSSGQLGIGSGSGTACTPTVVPGLSNVVDIAAGNLHTCALLSSGSVQCWGSNGDYELGDGTTTIRYNPVTVTGVGSGAAISAGGATNCVLTNTGGVVCWGMNTSGQLGDGTTTGSGPVGVSGLASGVIAIASGEQTNCALLSGNTMKCWGNGIYGQIGTGGGEDSYTPVDVTGLANITEIGLGQSHVCAIWGGSGTITCWGRNYNAQLGTGSGSDASAPNSSVFGISGSGGGVALGAEHSCALDNGTLKCWGYNYYGTLGNGSTTDSTIATTVSGLNGSVTRVVATANNTCAILGNTGVQCWGDNLYDQLGGGSGGAQSNSPVTVNNANGSGTGSGGGGTVITYSISSVGSGTGGGYAIDCFDPSTQKWSDGCSTLMIENGSGYGQVHWPNGSGSGSGVQFSPDWVLMNVTPGNLAP